MWSLVGMSVHVLIKDSDSLVWGVVGVVTCGRVSACPDQVNCMAHQTNLLWVAAILNTNEVPTACASM